jgi:hypothetical protein
MSRADTLRDKYGQDYYSRIAKQVKSRKGFHTQPKEFAQQAQRISAAVRKAKNEEKNNQPVKKTD